MTTQDDALAAVQEADRLWCEWREAVDLSLATGQRVHCREALRRFEAYVVARDRAKALSGTFGMASRAAVAAGKEVPA